MTAPGVLSADALERPADFATLEFFQSVAARLNESSKFAKATAWWDGSLLLKVGETRVWFKWYKGRVIDLHLGPSPLGYTFAIAGPADAWVQLVSEPLTSVRSWARFFVQGTLLPEGDIFEYRRLTVAVYVLIDEMRAVYAGRADRP